MAVDVEEDKECLRGDGKTMLQSIASMASVEKRVCLSKMIEKHCFI